MGIISWPMLAAYVVTVLLLMITPGPDMLFTLGTGIRSGPRAGFCAAVGAALGESVHMLAAAAGLAALFRASPVVYDVVRLTGAAYLVYLGIKTLRSRDVDLTAGAGGPTPRRALLRGMVVNLLNPKMALFTISFLPQFIDPSRGGVIAQFALLGAIFLAFELLVDGAVGLLAGRLRTVLTGRRTAMRRLNVTTGSIYLGLAAKIAATR